MMLSRFVVSQVKHNSYFVFGLLLGLWLALAAVPLDDPPEPCTPAPSPPTEDDFAPSRAPPPPAAAQRAAARSVQRPRYYSTELGMRAPLLAAVLTSEDALDTRVAALNHTLSRLSPALRFFLSASGPQAPGRASVVAFTDSREMLKPFHALKYLADNYLDEYDFFFLSSDTTFVNAHRLKELVSKLSVSQDVYMGTVAEDDSNYCTLDGGIVLSNSVLRAVAASLDWCVRNSYSPSHHENVGRCVLHAAHLRCQRALQGEQYLSIRVPGDAGGEGGGKAVGEGGGEAVGEGGAGSKRFALALREVLRPALADAVSASPLAATEHFYQLHAYVSRIHLERGRSAQRRLSRGMSRALTRAPPSARGSCLWPQGLRTDPSLPPPKPDSRWDHLRWTAFNTSHALMPDDHRAAAPLTPPYKAALQLVVDAAVAWASARGFSAQLISGAWRWEPAIALRYRLTMRMTDGEGLKQRVSVLEVSRALGAARLSPVAYVTESARLHALLPVAIDVRARAARDDVTAASDVSAAAAAARRFHAACLQRAGNAALTIVLVRNGTESESVSREINALLSTVESLGAPPSALRVLEAPWPSHPNDGDCECLATRVAVTASRLQRDALVLLATSDMDFTDDFLNRVRMNTIPGAQWYRAGAFRRFASRATQPRAGKSPPAGKFGGRGAMAFYKGDLDDALSSSPSPLHECPSSVLLRAGLRPLLAPEPQLQLRAPTGPHRATSGSVGDTSPGSPSALALLLLERQAGLGLSPVSPEAIAPLQPVVPAVAV